MQIPPAVTQCETASVAGGRTLFAAAIGLVSLALLYHFTIPGNHAEAQDAFWYAYDVRTKPYHALFHLHHLLYLPIMHLIYTTGLFADSYRMNIGVDIFCAVTTVGMLFGWLHWGLAVSRKASLFACTFLAFSYGFWRYAVETEVYLPAMVLQALLAWRVFRRPRPSATPETWRGAVLTALVATAAMLMHAPLSVPLAVVAAPGYLLITRRWRTFAVYGAVATVLVTAAYYTAFRMEAGAHDPTLAPVPTGFARFLAGAEGEDPIEISLSSIPKVAVGLGADVVASNYLFAIPGTRAKLVATFPGRFLVRDIFTASHYGIARAHFGLALTVILLGVIGFVAVTRLDWNATRLRTLFAAPENIAVALWLISYVGLVGVIEPENPENWICFLLPLAAAAGLIMHSLYRDLATAWLPWSFIALLLTQNLISGLLIIHRPATDFNVHKSAWILTHARAGDVVFTRDNQVFTRYLRYYSPAQIVNCFESAGAATRETLEKTAAAPGGKRYLYLDVLQPPAYMHVRFPSMDNDLAGLRREMLPILEPTGDAEVKGLPSPGNSHP